MALRLEGRIAIVTAAACVLAVPGGAPFTLWTTAQSPRASKGEPIGGIAGVIGCNASITFVQEAAPVMRATRS